MNVVHASFTVCYDCTMYDCMIVCVLLLAFMLETLWDSINGALPQLPVRLAPHL